MRDIRTKVSGVSHSNDDGTSRQEIIERHCFDGMKLLLQPDRDNKYDENAVAVYAEINGRHWQIGYLKPDVAKQVANHINSGLEAYARIIEITGGEEDRPSFGCNITVHRTENESTKAQISTNSSPSMVTIIIGVIAAALFMKGYTDSNDTVMWIGGVLIVLGVFSHLTRD